MWVNGVGGYSYRRAEGGAVGPEHAPQAVEAQAARLSEATAKALQRLERQEEGTPHHDAAFHQLVAAAEAQIDYERRLPALLAEPTRARTERLLTWTLRAGAVEALALGVAILAVRGPGPGWLLLPVVQLVAHLAAMSVPVDWRRHRIQRAAAALLVLGDVLAALIVTGIVHAWWWTLLAVVGWAAGWLALASERPWEQR